MVALTGQIITPTHFAGLQIETPQEYIPTINVLIYGKSGVGKTTLAASADAVPAMRKVLFVDIEAGALSIRKTPYKVDRIQVKSFDDLLKVYQVLKSGAHDYQTVIVDSLTEMQVLIMGKIMVEMLADPDNSDRDADIPSLREWGKNEVRVLRMLRNFRDLPMNVIFTALETEEKDPKNGKLMKYPDLPGKLKRKVPAIFDNVLYYYIKEDGDVQRRMILTTATSNIIAKNRGSDELPTLLEVKTVNVEAGMKSIYLGALGHKTPIKAVAEVENK